MTQTLAERSGSCWDHCANSAKKSVPNRRAFTVSTQVWGNTNYVSYDEHKAKADEVLQREVDKGYVQWSARKSELERQVGILHLAKFEVIVKGEKVRLIPKSAWCCQVCRTSWRKS